MIDSLISILFETGLVQYLANMARSHKNLWYVTGAEHFINTKMVYGLHNLMLECAPRVMRISCIVAHIKTEKLSFDVDEAFLPHIGV